MKNIKFRAWDKITKKIYNVSSIFWDKEFLIYSIDLIDTQNKMKKCITRTINQIELLEYTGLKDKNGKEMWEGDIVKFIWMWMDYIGIVVWDIGYIGYAINVKEDRDIEIVSVNECDNIEIIGNIYENPELLN